MNGLNEYIFQKLNSSLFTWSLWRAGSIHDLDIKCRYPDITSSRGSSILKKHAVGWCNGENLMCRPKENHVAIMFLKDDNYFWFHLRKNEFDEVFLK